MFDWLTGIVGEDAAPIAAYILIFVILLIGFFIVRAALRQMRGGTFVNGGRGRKQRLAIIDATPVDNRRRLVLVRRDNVEHLVLIGGMNDLVIERDIEIQSTNKAELAKSTPDSNLQQSNAIPNTQSVKPTPPRIPQPKPQLSPVIKTQKAERPASPRAPTAPVAPPAAPTPATKEVEATAAPVAAAAITGLADVQFSKELENATKEVVQPMQVNAPKSQTTPSGRFSAYAEQENTESYAAIEASDTVKPSDDSTDEFMPINAPTPKTMSTESASQNIEPPVKDNDSDLEDEMEQLLNKLTKPSTL